MEPDAVPALKRTPLHAMHVRLGARMVPFAGYEMPLQYGDGIIREHLHTRTAAGLFDVSHMGQIVLRPHSGGVQDAARALETLVPGDIVALAPERQRYTLFTNAAGGVIDDLMVSNQGDHLRLVVNAGRKDVDMAHLRDRLADACHIDVLDDRALLALQGPLAEAALARLAPEATGMQFMDARPITLIGETCLVSRSGYTAKTASKSASRASGRRHFAMPCWAMQPSLRPASVPAIPCGSKPDCAFTGPTSMNKPPRWRPHWHGPSPPRAAQAARVPADFQVPSRSCANSPTARTRRRVGLRPQGRAPVRAGAPLFLGEHDAAPAGIVTSGGFGISLDAPVAMGYLPVEAAMAGTRVFADVRGKRLPVTVAALPFVPPHYKHR